MILFTLSTAHNGKNDIMSWEKWIMACSVHKIVDYIDKIDCHMRVMYNPQRFYLQYCKTKVTRCNVHLKSCWEVELTQAAVNAEHFDTLKRNDLIPHI